MNRILFSGRAVARYVAALCFVTTVAGASAQADDKTAATAEALIYSTMPSTAAHRPEAAMDGDPNTYFKTVYGMGGGDDFQILFSSPVPVHSLRVVTGDTENQDLLTDGVVQTSPDGIAFQTAATFNTAGVAEATLADAALPGTPVLSLRIRLNPRRGVPSLLVREITIDSPVKISHVQYGPGRGFVDISQAPDLVDWARRAEKQMEEFWPDTAALLYSDNFITPNKINVVYRTGPGVTPVAATGGGVMTVNSQWCRQQPNDTGLMVHEMAHVVQSMSAYRPVWLIEGIADYIRWVKFEPQNHKPRINTQTATYHDSYRTTGTFLAWCEIHYDSALVRKLNNATRFGNYSDDLFKKYCGKDVDTLWAEFIEDYKKDPVNIIVPPMPPANRPRNLPEVAVGASIPVDLATAFDLMGIAKDGVTFPETSGFDEGGAAYAADLLGPTLTWKNVQFKIGEANARNVLSSKGNVLPLAEGNFASLWLLGSAVQGNQMDQKFTVTYTDGTTETLTQNFSDWFEPQRFVGESRALKMAYRIMNNGAQDPRPFYVYSYGFSLNNAKTVKSLTLPDNSNVKLLAITLAH